MDTPSVSFTGTLTLQDALDLHRYRGLCILRPSLRWLIGIVSFVLAALCVTVIAFGKGTPPLWIILGLCAYIPAGRWYERRWAVRRQYRRHPEYFIEYTVIVDENHVFVANANLNMRLAWNQIAFLLATPRGLMFMLPQMRPLCWLPQRLFEGNDAKVIIIGYAKNKNIPTRLMK